MKLIYIANTRIPTEKAHGWAIMKMCESFAKCGNEVELVVPFRVNPTFEGKDPFAYYDIENKFNIIPLSCLDLITPTKYVGPFKSVLGFFQNYLYARALKKYLADKKDAVLFSREHRLLFLLRDLPNKMVYEVHDFPEHKKSWYKKLFERVNLVVSTNGWKRDELIKEYMLSEKKVVVEPNALDEKLIKSMISKEEARKRLGLPLDARIAVYMGGFAAWKGVYVLGGAGVHLKKHAELSSGLEDYSIHMVGGVDGAKPNLDRVKFENWLKEEKIPNVTTHPAVPHSEIYVWLSAADVLVAPGTEKDPNAKLYTSPLKIFDYLASGKSLVLTKLSAIHQTLKSVQSLGHLEYAISMVPPDDPFALAQGIIVRMKFGGENILPRTSKIDLHKAFWFARATRILQSINKL